MVNVAVINNDKPHLLPIPIFCYPHSHVLILIHIIKLHYFSTDNKGL